MIVRINGKEYEFSFDSVWGPLYVYEEVAGETMPFDARKTLCMHILWWCILLRANKDFTLQLEEFLQALNDMELVRTLRDYYMKRMTVLGEGSEDEAESDKKKD